MTGVAAAIAAALPQARADMDATMLDRFRVTKPGGAAVLNRATGKLESPDRVVVYEGKGRIQVRADINSNVVETVIADREAAYQTSTLQLPIQPDTTDPDLVGDPADVRPGMVAECLTAAFEPALVGREFGIVSIAWKSQATCRRCRVKEVTG